MKNTINAIILATLTFIGASNIQAAPANDHWGSATLILNGTGEVTGSVTGATTQTCEPQLVMPDEGSTPPKKSVWFKWQAPANGSYTFYIDDSATTVNTILAAYKILPGLCNGNVTDIPYQITANNNYNSEYNLNFGSQISFRATAGDVMHLSVSSSTNFDGDFKLKWKKTKFRPDVSLDNKNGGADLLIPRGEPTGTTFWTYRFGPSTSFFVSSAVRFGWVDDESLMADFDGDRVSDMVAVRRHDGKYFWWIAHKDGQMIKVVQFGLQTDDPIIGDYDGDGIADIAVVRNDAVANTKTFHILRSKDGQYMTTQFGYATDRPMAGDYDGDGKTDIVVIRPENGLKRWFIQHSSTMQVVSRVFGNAIGDYPQDVDFDGDGRTDIAVFRMADLYSDDFDGYWFSLDSSSSLPLDQVPTRYQQFGQVHDLPQPADYDGDGKTDLAVYRDGIWWIKHSHNGVTFSYSYGLPSDYPATDGGMLHAQMSYYTY